LGGKYLAKSNSKDDIDWGHNFVLLETLRKDKDNAQNLLFSQPLAVITCYRKNELKKCFQKIAAFRQKGFYLAGFLSYELGYLLEEALEKYQPPQDLPLLWLGVYKKPQQLKKTTAPAGNYFITPPVFTENLSEYENKIKKIKELIRDGETYQINYTSSYKFDFWGDVFSFYAKLKEKQEVSYASLINYGGNCIISLSPELFFRIDRKRHITVKPMKGTAAKSFPRGWLPGNEKNIAENVMIVDLLRNDLGRICAAGSVKAVELFAVEEYKTLWQMTSTIKGKLLPEVGISDIIKSLFPCGSVTGAPKINSMKIIRTLEKEPRGVYTGAIGYLAPDNSAVFNVAIRTIDLVQSEKEKYHAQMGIGGGIVYDSKPDEEYAECLLKGQFLIKSLPAFALIETMLVTKGAIKYLDLHLRRLKTSARHFHIPCNTAAIKQQLQKYAAKLKDSFRVRLLLDSYGKTSFDHSPLAIQISSPLLIAVSRRRTNSQDQFLYHKTTLRNLYNAEYKKYSSRGCFDVVFCNEKEELTEGAISNIFLEKDGCLYTPPLSCGLLNGIGRRLMLKKQKVKEKILSLNDLKKADRIFLTNSVRGVNQVFLR
jgi:para-aminobenzoate synthetase / 4-amino-4-deoxychorismate lyase